MKEVEYRVRPIVRYSVTRWEREDFENGMASSGCDTRGTFDNEETAKLVASALFKAEVGQAIADGSYPQKKFWLDDSSVKASINPANSLDGSSSVEASLTGQRIG